MDPFNSTAFAVLCFLCFAIIAAIAVVTFLDIRRNNREQQRRLEEILNRYKKES